MIHPFFEQEIEVTEKYLDEMHHVNNVCYVQWMQEVAIAHSVANGWPTERYLQCHHAWFARSHEIEYLTPAFLGDKLIVQTWLCDLKFVSCTRKYRFIRPENHAIIVKASTRWGFVNLDTQRPVRVIPEVLNCFLALTPDQEPPIR